MQEATIENVGIRGFVTVRRHPAGTVERLEALHKAAYQHERDGDFEVAAHLHGHANAILKQGEIGAQSRNIIVCSASRGIDLLIQWLISGANSAAKYPVGPSWGEIGTGTTTPALTDTALQSPSYRAQVSTTLDSGFNEAQLQFFFSDSQVAAGSYTEFGMYVSNSPTLGSGQLFNHALFSSAYSKTSGNDTTVECDILIANTP